MLWNFHGLIVEGLWEDAPIGERWRATFASRPQIGESGRGASERSDRDHALSSPDLVLRLALADEAPPAPSVPPDFRQGDLLAYYIRGTQVTAQLPRFGQLHLDLSRGTTTGVITSAALATYGVFEDLLAIGLSPHLRRRGLFLIHAFAAATPTPAPLARRSQTTRTGEGAFPPPLSGNLPTARKRESGVGVLLVGDIGAGKTTTGLALLHAGWKLLSNDSPILSLTQNSNSNSNSNLKVLSYPGLLSAYPDTLARFPELAHFNSSPEARQKILFAAESVYPDVWLESAHPAAIFFPQVESRANHALERLPAPEALPLILPHAIEQWDREMIPAHLALLNQLIQSAPAYRLRLGPDIGAIPSVIASALSQSRR